MEIPTCIASLPLPVDENTSTPRQKVLLFPRNKIRAIYLHSKVLPDAEKRYWPIGMEIAIRYIVATNGSDHPRTDRSRGKGKPASNVSSSTRSGQSELKPMNPF